MNNCSWFLLMSVYFIEVKPEPTKDYSDIWKLTGGILTVAVYFQPWEGFTCHQAVQGQKEEVPLLTQRAEHLGVPWRGGRGSPKKRLRTPKWPLLFWASPLFLLWRWEKRPHSPGREIPQAQSSSGCVSLGQQLPPLPQIIPQVSSPAQLSILKSFRIEINRHVELDVFGTGPKGRRH